MLPFLKNRSDGSEDVPDQSIKREHDEDYDMLDAVAQDVMDAIKAGDKAALKEALSAFVDHIQTQDEQQDQEMGE